MHEIEYMIRFILQSGPQRGSDVRRWVCDASGFSRRQFYMLASEMPDLGRGYWLLHPSASHSMGENSDLYRRLSAAVIQQREAA